MHGMVLHRPVELAALTVHVGTSTQVTGNATNQELAAGIVIDSVHYGL